jgi:hypothetical protein
MKNLLLIPLLFMSAACVTVGKDTPIAPVSIANQTALDEKALLDAKMMYLATNRLAVFMLDNKVLATIQLRAQVADIDHKMFEAWKAARTAYRMGNATSFYIAFNEMKALKADLKKIVLESNV